MRVAAVSWQIQPTNDVEEFLRHAERLVSQCAAADLVVLPELPCLELLGDRQGLSQPETAGFLADLTETCPARFGDMAARYGCILLAGTLFVRTPTGVQNRAVVAFPDGTYTCDVPKVVMTRFEAEEWGVEPGAGLRTLPEPRLGVTVCYDCEFPESGRALAGSGVLVQAVPAYTESVHGFQRVRWCCKARAVENQVFVVHSSLVGSLGREPVISATGTSAVLCPSVPPFPESAVLAETDPDAEGVAIAVLDFDALGTARASGDVRNWEDRHRGDWSVRPVTWPATSRP